MTGKSKAQQFYDSLEDLAVELNSICQLSEQLDASFARSSVKRSGDIHLLRYKISDFPCEKGMRASDELVSESARIDAAVMRQIDLIGIGLMQVYGSIQQHKDQFSELWNSHSQELSNVRSDLRNQHDRASRLEARLREHSLSNPSVRTHVWSITDGKCFYCDVELNRERDPNEPHKTFCIDHLVAKSNGGPDHTSNYVPACQRCNSSKSSKSFVEFTSWLRQQREEPELKVVGGTDV